MFYIHFWSKNGELERIPYSTVEQAEKAAWVWERIEADRINPTRKIGGMPGSLRDKMITIISDEEDQICLVPHFGMNFIFDLAHCTYVMNDSWWAIRFEAASRGLVPGAVVCPTSCWVCCGEDKNQEKPNNKIAEDKVQKESINDKILCEFDNGISRRGISEMHNVSYQKVCKIIRER